MKALMTPDALRRAVRTRVCDHCPHCTPGYEGTTPDAARPCEGNCTLFRSLPALKRVADCADPMLRSPMKAAVDLMDRICTEERKRLGQMADDPKARARKARGRRIARIAAEGRG